MIQDYFSPYLKEDYKFTIGEVTLSRDQKTLFIDMDANFLLPFADLETIKNQIRGELPGIEGVAFRMRFLDMAMSRNEVVGNSISHMKARLRGNPWVRSMESDGFAIEDETLIIYVLGERAATALNESAAADFSRLLAHDFGYDYKVRFANNEADMDRTMEELVQAEEEPPYIEIEPKKEAKPAKGDVVKGRKISDAPSPMHEALEKGDKTTVAGRIFEVDTVSVAKSEKAKKYSKNNDDRRLLVRIGFSDKTDSMCAKFFCENDEWPAMEDALKKGAAIIVRGNISYDTFDRMDVLNARDINRFEMPGRVDLAEEKRVELHAHTKMSALDAVTKPEDLVKQAIAWGHKAVAITDHGVVHALPNAYDAGRGKIKVILGVEGYLYNDECKWEDGVLNLKKDRNYHIVLLAKNKKGLYNLYKLISLSHMEFFYNRPLLPKSILAELREGLIIGSACQAGELYQAILNGADDDKLKEIASFYDYLEVQPLSNNSFMVEDERYIHVQSLEDIKDMNRKVLALGKELDLPVVATSDTHYLDPEDNVVRQIIQAGLNYNDVEKEDGLYFKTTEEMFEEMSYFDPEDQYDLVVGNPNKIADQIEEMAPTPGSEYPRPVIENADEILRDRCYDFAKNRYGDPMPEEIQSRLDQELTTIIGHGYAVMYVSAMMLVEKSNADGYVVGSRGSVGSSLVAFMSGVSEVNPLKPHYVCPNCKKVIWGDEEQYECGPDLPPMDCPECGHAMDRDGFTIPFETFLGFPGEEKEPDIDLNFAGEYQATAQQYVDEIFGAKNTMKAGTVGTVKEKTAFGFISAYTGATHKMLNRMERERLAMACEGVKRTTGQHPGGIVIVPEGHDVYEVTPIQYPANKKDSGIVTTHFEYHSYEKALLKLDILGHDGPSIVRLLKDSSGIDPETVPYNDPKVLSLFTGTSALDIRDPDYRYTDGTYGVPEFGTPIARGMLNDTHPTTIGELVRLSGLAHGTDVWTGNAKDLIMNNIATMNEVIATRDDIMTYLISKGVPDSDAFDIMEKVRKGRGIPDGKEAIMRQCEVPEWYIESCNKIKYMFPRGHAAAYVIMSCRIAYFKVYYPAHFYAARLTSKVDDFNWDVVKLGQEAVWNRMREIDRIIETAEPGTTTTKIEEEQKLLEIIYEMYARGITFEPPSFAHSAGDHFTVYEDRVTVPFNGLSGIGTNAGAAIYEAMCEEPFRTVEDLQVRGKANKTVIEALRGAGVLDGMEESDQISMF